MARKAKLEWINTRVDDDLLKEVREYADSKDLSVAGVVRMALREYLWARPRKPKITELKGE